MLNGGFKLSLAGAKGKRGPNATPDQPTKKRRLALGDDEPEDDNVKQDITGWDAAAGGAVDASTPKEAAAGPRVIPVLPNRDWREEARKRKLAHAKTAESENGAKAEPVEQPKMAYGLTTFDTEEGQPKPMSTTDSPKNEDTVMKDPDDNLTEEQKLQDEALQALVNGKTTDTAVIPISEEEAYRNDIRNAPDAPTLASYEATPIEGFGAALLRGMGWKDGESIGRDKKPLKAVEIKRRPALLGIGAKPESAVGIELSDTGKGKKLNPQAMAQQFNPVAMRNKRTGELITEEELKERLKKQKLADEKAARNNTYVDDDEDDERRREKRRERKERDRRDDYDDDRRREKRRDKDSRHRNRSRSRSPYEDDRRDKRRVKDSRDKNSRYNDRSRNHSPYDDRREKRLDCDRRDDSDDYRREKEKRRERERRRSRSRESDDRRKKSRHRDYDDDRRDSDDRRKERRRHEYEDDRRKYKDDKYYSRK